MKGIVAAFIAGLVVGLATGQLSEPHCPQEDSCIADYTGDRWVIEERTP